MSPPVGISGGNGVEVPTPVGTGDTAPGERGGSPTQSSSSESPAASESGRRTFFSSQQSFLKGYTVFLVFNPAARGGQVASELGEAQNTLKGLGAEVILVETVADQAARRTKIQDAAREAMARGQRLYVLPYGGDGTIWETVGEVVKAAGIPIEGAWPIPGTPESNTETLRSRAAFLWLKQGTAADNAAQVGAPKKVADLPKYLGRAVELPFWFSTLETSSAPGVQETTGHSFGLGASGLMFYRRQQNLKNNPNNFFNRGLLSFLGPLGRAIIHPHTLFGFDLDLKHYDRADNLKRESLIRASEVLVTPNRIIAFAGGIPGSWGETKMVILPAGPRGVVTFLESVSRGLITKLGINMVGPLSSLRSLPQERKQTIEPGERVEVDIRVPDTLAWDFLRVAQRRTSKWAWLGIGEPWPEVPKAGEKISIPGIANGDLLAEPVESFTVRAPEFSISMLAHPDSIAVDVARSSALAKGIHPLINDAQLVGNLGPSAAILRSDPKSTSVRTPFLSQDRLMELMGRNLYQIPHEAMLDLVSGSAGVSSVDQLHRLGSSETTVEQVHSFLESPRGEQWLEIHRGNWRGLGTRTLQGGVPLGLGIYTLFKGEDLMDHMGLDREGDRALRFALLMYGAHAVQANVAPLWEVASNRLLGRPWDYARTRNLHIAGETLSQYTLTKHRSLPKALGSSWVRGSLGLEAGVSQSLSRRALKIGAIPLLAAGNMGPGLIASRLTDSMVRGLPEDSWLRNYGPTLAFFTPDIGRILAPRSTFRLLNYKAMRYGGRLFAAGFIGDLAFSGAQRLQHGQGVVRENQLNWRTSELRRESGDIGSLSWRNAVRFIAPSLGAHIDSHDYLFGRENEFRRQIREEEREFSTNLRSQLRATVPKLSALMGKDVAELFAEPVELNSLERQMLRYLETTQEGMIFSADGNLEVSSRRIQRSFSGRHLSEEEAAGHLGRIYLSQLQGALASLISLKSPGDRDLRNLFSIEGQVLSGREEALQRYFVP